jgi:class 3 adenylate cyclase
MGRLSTSFNSMAEKIETQTEEIQEKNRENEELLLNILPGPIATRLKSGEAEIADGFAEVTVLFGDIVGFTSLSSGRAPNEVVSLLNGLFRKFDDIATGYGIEKIKTIGDCYMATAGLPTPNPDHALIIVKAAIDMMRVTHEYGKQFSTPLNLRIGVNSGPVVAGVIGKIKFIYDMWGDTVNVASRMESTGVPGNIQVTEPVFQKLKGQFEFEDRGTIEVKGKGAMRTWLLKVPDLTETAAEPARGIKQGD